MRSRPPTSGGSAGWRKRADGMAEHHERRLAELLAAIAAHPDATSWDLAGRLTWSRSWDQYSGRMRISAVTETAAHVLELLRRGLIGASGGDVPTYRVAEPGRRLGLVTSIASRWALRPSRSKMTAMTSAGPPWAVIACGDMVENCAACPASTRIAHPQLQPDGAGQHVEPLVAGMHALLAPWLGAHQAHLGHGEAVRLVRGWQLPGDRIAAKVATRPDDHRGGRTSSTNWSRPVPSARAIGTSWSIEMRRCPVRSGSGSRR